VRALAVTSERAPSMVLFKSIGSRSTLATREKVRRSCTRPLAADRFLLNGPQGHFHHLAGRDTTKRRLRETQDYPQEDYLFRARHLPRVDHGRHFVRLPDDALQALAFRHVLATAITPMGLFCGSIHDGARKQNRDPFSGHFDEFQLEIVNRSLHDEIFLFLNRQSIAA